MASRHLSGKRREARDAGAFDPYRVCTHRPEQTYTREPCSCGRSLWPPRGRGRGESVLSARRIQAFMRAMEAVDLRMAGWTYEAIAARLGYKDRRGAWWAVVNLLGFHPMRPGIYGGLIGRFERQATRRARTHGGAHGDGGSSDGGNE